MVSPSKNGESVNVSVRKIDNGYITSTYKCGPGVDDYTHVETFSETKPNIETQSAEPQPAMSSLAKTKTLWDSLRG